MAEELASTVVAALTAGAIAWAEAPEHTEESYQPNHEQGETEYEWGIPQLDA